MENNQTKFKETELGLIPEDWQVSNMGNCLELIVDYRGKTPKKLGLNWSTSGYRALSAKNIANGEIKNPESVNYADDELYKKWMKDEVQRGDILLTSEAPLGEYYYWNSDEKIVLSQRLFCLRPKKDVIDSAYFYQFVKSPFFQEELKGRETGSTVTGIRQSELVKTKVILPSLKEQRKIAEVLGALDEKIELNRKINKTLESLAQAIFRKWFIDDADPNWENGFLGDLVEDAISGDWGKDRPENHFNFEVFCIRGADVPEIKKSDCGKPPVRFVKDNQQKLLRDGDIVIECSGGTSTQQTGRSVLVTDRILERFDHPLICSNFCKILRVSDIPNAPFVISVLNNIYSNDEIYQYESGTTGIKNLNLESLLKSYQIRIPSADVLKRFSEAYLDLYMKLQHIGKENQLLSLIRDSLLPRLMSGKLRVK